MVLETSTTEDVGMADGTSSRVEDGSTVIDDASEVDVTKSVLSKEVEAGASSELFVPTCIVTR